VHGPTETRKVVTILFSDLAGSTALGERLDPEAVRSLMARYFAEMSAVLRRHGGTTEKFIGDAIMAVFGIPQLHEDDALRAVRAAVEMRDALAALNNELDREFGVRIVTRTGLNTGEVVAGDVRRGEAFVVGDAVNLAARLEQVAGPGAILIGESTYRLVAELVSAEAVPPLSVKGKEKPVRAWELRDVVYVADAGRRLDSPLVGRDAEWERLDDAFRRVTETGRCEVVTVFGAAGTGKSRLAAEFVGGLEGRARIVSGRCLPYGEGITFWPVVEVIRDAAGIDDHDSPEEARTKIFDLVVGPDAALVGERVAALLGLTDAMPAIQETFWAMRRLLEALAADGPLVVVFNDIHWAEPTLLDLVDSLAERIEGAPVLLLCLARNELLELRPDWLTGKENAVRLTLDPLGDGDVDALIDNLLDDARLPDEARSRIAAAAEGNPLFVEETLRMFVDEGLLEFVDGAWTAKGDFVALAIPPTIHALLASRLDRLGHEERAVIERGAVMGRTFWAGAVEELAPDELRPLVGLSLGSLARKELIRPDRSELRDEDAFRFTHILTCDAAYRGIPKALRADVHERFAAWLEQRSREGVGEYEEIVGYHLEQAHRCLTELGRVAERQEALARRASALLAAAGRRAFARGDMPAAVNLLSRALSLSARDGAVRAELLPDFAFALLETGDFESLLEVVGEAGEAAAATGDRRLEAKATVLGLWVRMFTDPEGWAASAQREATAAIDVFAELADEAGLAKAWSLLGLHHLMKCEWAAAEQAWEQAATHAGAAGEERERLECLSWLPVAAWGGPSPVDDAIARCGGVLQRADGDRKAMANALLMQGVLEAMHGRFPEARGLVVQAKEKLEELSLPVLAAGPFAQMTAWVELLAGDPAAAEQELRPSLPRLRALGELAYLPTIAAILAEAVFVQGNLDEAAELVDLCEETAAGDDAYSLGLARAVRAKVLARRGDGGEAGRVGRDAVAISERTDCLFLQWFALSGLGEALQASGRREDAEAALVAALDVCERKDFSVGAARVRALLGREELRV
jgi:class 3 adenylate cyclase/tetratricopeptide (TPR) repeat protein